MLAVRTLFFGAGLLLLTAAADATLNAEVSRPLPVAMAVGSVMYGAVALLPASRIRAFRGRSASARVIGPASWHCVPSPWVTSRLLVPDAGMLFSPPQQPSSHSPSSWSTANKVIANHHGRRSERNSWPGARGADLRAPGPTARAFLRNAAFIPPWLPPTPRPHRIPERRPRRCPSPHHLLRSPATGLPALGVGMTTSPCRTDGPRGGVTGSGGTGRPLIGDMATSLFAGREAPT